MAKRIVGVGVSIPNEDVKYVEFQSNESVVDADILLFDTDFLDNYSTSSQKYDGVPVFSDYSSKDLETHIRHWLDEITEALRSGKTVLVFVESPTRFYRHTDEQIIEGTGRTSTTPSKVVPVTNLDILPVRPGQMMNKSGDGMKLAPGADCWSEYFSLLVQGAKYNAWLDESGYTAVVTTLNGRKVVGGMRRVGPGVLALLPPLSLDWEALTDKDGEDYSPAGRTLGKQIVKTLVQLDKCLHEDAGEAPPDWSQKDIYRFAAEREAVREIARLDKEMELLRQAQSDAISQTMELGEARRLLFAAGHSLEAAIIDALKLLGFEAHNFKEGGSEFDVVFQSQEGRFIGEVEGKDTKPINVDKVDQLERNIREDFDRPEIADYAKPVLFGNAYRKRPPEERGEYFTEKCMSAAKRGRVALVRTPDLFAIVRYLRERDDDEFATDCRRAIVESEGQVVEFPAIPRRESDEQVP